MSRSKSHYVCQSCGSSHPKWAGRCEACGEWNTLVEEELTVAPGGLKKSPSSRGRALEFQSLEGESAPLPRRRSAIAEFDRVAGGGLVPGSAVLVGGDPGIGKSTLLLQAVASMAAGPDKVPCLYISGEEAIDQVRLRARRLGLEKSPVGLATATSVRDIAASLEGAAAGVVVIDSIQTTSTISIPRRAPSPRCAPRHRR
jgi:DNA repair protein RadA/Sms